MDPYGNSEHREQIWVTRTVTDGSTTVPTTSTTTTRLSFSSTAATRERPTLQIDPKTASSPSPWPPGKEKAPWQRRGRRR